jgi:hypothetical protein
MRKNTSRDIPNNTGISEKILLTMYSATFTQPKDPTKGIRGLEQERFGDFI